MNEAGSLNAIMFEVSEFVKELKTGNVENISYEFFHVLDEIGHGLHLDNFEWFYHFCQWSHRKN
jgi:hypothetical protein